MRHGTLAAVLAIGVAAVAEAQPGAELIERTLAIVGGRAVTLSDVRAATALQLIEPAASLDAATEKLVERALVLREVDRYAPPEPLEGEVDDRIAAIRRRFSDEEFRQTLAAGGFTPARLRGWVRDDLRIAAYLNQRFAAAAEVFAEQAPAGQRERLAAERRASLIADWITDLRRRTPVLELWRR